MLGFWASIATPVHTHTQCPAVALLQILCNVATGLAAAADKPEMFVGCYAMILLMLPVFKLLLGAETS